MHGVVTTSIGRFDCPTRTPKCVSKQSGACSSDARSKGGGTSVLLVPGAVRGRKNPPVVWDRSIAQPEVNTSGGRTSHTYSHRNRLERLLLQTEQFRDYIDEINSPWVQAYYDIGNMQKFAPSHEWIRILGKRTLKLDVKDWGSKNGFCPLGQGDVNWSKVRDELEKLDFKGWATREGNDGGVEKTAKLMNELLGL